MMITLSVVTVEAAAPNPVTVIKPMGFSELSISNFDMKRLGGSGVEVVPAIMAPEAAALFNEWLANPRHREY